MVRFVGISLRQSEFSFKLSGPCEFQDLVGEERGGSHWTPS